MVVDEAGRPSMCACWCMLAWCVLVWCVNDADERARTSVVERTLDVRALCMFAPCCACMGAACVHVGSRTMTYEASRVLVVDGVKERVESEHARSRGMCVCCCCDSSDESESARFAKCGGRSITAGAMGALQTLSSSR